MIGTCEPTMRPKKKQCAIQTWTYENITCILSNENIELQSKK